MTLALAALTVIFTVTLICAAVERAKASARAAHRDWLALEGRTLPPIPVSVPYQSPVRE